MGARIPNVAPRAPRGTNVANLEPGRLRAEPAELWLYNTPHFRLAARLGATRFMFAGASDRSTGRRVLNEVAPAVAQNPNSLIAIGYWYGDSSYYNVYTPFTRIGSPVEKWKIWGGPSNTDISLREFVELQEPGSTIVCDAPAPTDGINGETFPYHWSGIIAEVQNEFPEVKIIARQSTTDYSLAFGSGLRSVAMHMNRSTFRHGAVGDVLTLPSGLNLRYDKAIRPEYKSWFHLLGYSQARFASSQDPNKINEFNIRSMLWASKYWTLASPFTLGSRVFRPAQIAGFAMTPAANLVLPVARRRVARALGPDSAKLDQVFCNTCLLNSICPLSRAGEVCGLKGSAFVELADELGSRDPNKILGGLSRLLKIQASRIDVALEEEELTGRADPKVSALIASVFNQGANMVKLLKAIEDTPAVAAAVTVNVNSTAQPTPSITSSDARSVADRLVAELEEIGIPRSEITPEIVKTVMRHYTEYGENATRATLRNAVKEYIKTEKPKRRRSKELPAPESVPISTLNLDADESGILAEPLPFNPESERFTGDGVWGGAKIKSESSGTKIKRVDMSEFIPTVPQKPPAKPWIGHNRQDDPAVAVDKSEYDPLPDEVSAEQGGDLEF